MAIMEGTLWKWTNYLSGWQPRWFVLEVGVLAYYKSQEEVGLGSRGSVKMACCEISVHSSDSMRIDLKVPPDQHIYLRAATPAERQQWLVALGTAKACLTTLQHNGHAEMPVQAMGQLKEKMQELDMYRSLLLQQISTIKLLCSSKQDSQEFSEAATMLSATCDEFLKNICDCVELAESSFGSSPSSPTSPSVSMNKTLTTTKHSSLRRQLLHDGHRSSSPPPSPSPSSSSVASTLSSSYNGPPSLLTTTSDQSGGSERTPVANGKHPSTQAASKTAENRSSTNSTYQNDRRHGDAAELDIKSAATREAGSIESSRQSLDSQSSNSEDSRESEPLTFFTAAKFRFEKIQMGPDNGIPTRAFLSSCSCILPFLDVLGSTAFAPVKMDISGNIKKLAAKHDTDPKAFITLQNIIYQELKSNSCTAKNSATDALLWLKRALEFMQVFLSEVVRGEQDLAVAAGTAYGKTLRRFHGWVVRGVFALAVKAVPYRSDFLTSLGTTEKGLAPNEAVLRDMKLCVDGLSRVTSIINQLYQKYNLNSDSTV